MARATVLALEDIEAPRTPGAPRVYNIASGEPHTVGAMATALATAYGTISAPLAPMCSRD